MAKIAVRFAVAAAILGVLEVLLGLSSMICAFVHSGKVRGELYAKYYSSSPVNIEAVNAKPYWWGGIPFLVPGICGLAVVFSKSPLSMILFIITNVACFFVSIAQAVVVGLFIGIWKILYDTYKANLCTYQYDQTLNKIYCKCKVKDFNAFDADRVRIFVDSCDDVEVINTVLVAIIALGCVSAVFCLVASIVGCVGLVYKESPYKSKKSNKQIQQQYLMQQEQAMQQAKYAAQQSYQPAAAPQQSYQPAVYQPPSYTPPAARTAEPQSFGTNEASMML